LAGYRTEGGGTPREFREKSHENAKKIEKKALRKPFMAGTSIAREKKKKKKRSVGSQGRRNIRGNPCALNHEKKKKKRK